MAAAPQAADGVTLVAVAKEGAPTTIELACAAGQIVGALAADGDTVAILFDRSTRPPTAAPTRTCRMVMAWPRDIESRLNSAAREGFRLRADSPVLERDGRLWLLMEADVAIGVVEYRVSKRILFRDRHNLLRDARSASDADAELQPYAAAGFRPILAIGGQVVLERPSGVESPVLVRVVKGTAAQAFDSVRALQRTGYRIAVADIDERDDVLVVLESGETAQDSDGLERLIVADSVVRLQAAMRGEAALGFRLWSRGMVTQGGGFSLAVMRLPSEGIPGVSPSYRFAATDHWRAPLGHRQGERLVGVGPGGLVVFETAGASDRNVTDLVREGRRWTRRATHFADLQLQNYDDLGSRVVVAAAEETAAGTLVSVTPDFIAIRQGGRLREFAGGDVVSVRSRSAVKISVLVGLLAGAGVGLGVYIAADKSCAGSADPGACRAIGVLAPVLLPAMYATLGGGLGAVVGLLIPGPHLYEKERPSPSVAIAFSW